jgi:hypothetical protein
MPRGRNITDLTTLEMALVGYKLERQRIDEKIREIESQLKGHSKSIGTASLPAGGSETPTKTGRRPLSAAARRRIAAAQKKRWAEHRKRVAQATKES